MIAVFSHRRAVESDRVVKELARRGTPFVRVNTGHLEATAALHAGSGEPSTVSCDGRTVRLDDIDAAWLHQVPWAAPPAASDSPLSAAADSSRRQVWEAAMAMIPDERWITPPLSLRMAGNKAYQARFAEAAGCPVPPMALTNDPHTARRIASTPAVMKYAGESIHLWQRGANGHAAVAVEADLSAVDDEMLMASPAIFQARVETVAEVRVVAIGQPEGDSAVFAASGSKPPGIVDIRLADGGTARYAPTVLPAATVSAISRLLRSLRVGFCSADLLMDPDGTFWFVDLNATGAWWWIDDLYDHEVTRAITTRLEALAQ